MIRRTSLVFAAILLAATPALATQKVVAVVHVASANLQGGVLVLTASVDLPNTCWSNPRFGPVPRRRPDARGQVQIEVVATTTERPGRACGMVYRPAVAVPALRWRHPPRGLRAINVVGSQTAALATVTNGPPLAPSPLPWHTPDLPPANPPPR